MCNFSFIRLSNHMKASHFPKRIKCYQKDRVKGRARMLTVPQVGKAMQAFG